MSPLPSRRIGLAALLASALAHGPALADSGQRFTAGAPGADSFGSNPKLSCPRSGAMSTLADELKEASQKAKRPEPKLDGRLCVLAQALLSWDPAAGETPPAPVLAFASANVGLPVPVKRVLVTILDFNAGGGEGDGDTKRSELRSAQSRENDAVASSLQKGVGEVLMSYQQPRWGMVVDRVKKGVFKVAVVMDDPILELEPLPRKLAAGQSAPISGKVLPPYRNPRLAISDEKGQVVKPEPTPGDAFKGEVKCGSTPGDIWVEVQAERGGQTSPMASFSIACGKDLPTSVALSGGAWPTDLPGQEKRLADGINAQREAAGLAKLDWDDKLAGVARNVARLLGEQLARGENPSVDLGKELEKAGVASGLVLQNPGQARSAEEAEQRFTASPTNRQNLLNPEVNRVGVGIAPGKDAAGKPAVLVVELFTKAMAQVDPEAVKRDLYAAIEKRRAEASVAAAKVDPKLEKVAEQYATALAQAAGKLSDADASEITHGIRIAYKSIDMLEGAKANPLDFAADQTVVAPGTSIGLGVAQGDHPVLGKNAVYVTFIVATPRVGESGKPKKKK